MKPRKFVTLRLVGTNYRALLADRNDPIVRMLNAAGVRPMTVRKSAIFPDTYVRAK